MVFSSSCSHIRDLPASRECGVADSLRNEQCCRGDLKRRGRKVPIALSSCYREQAEKYLSPCVVPTRVGRTVSMCVPNAILFLVLTQYAPRFPAWCLRHWYAIGHVLLGTDVACGLRKDGIEGLFSHRLHRSSLKPVRVLCALCISLHVRIKR